jgi:nickel-dependent lactate racemase
MDLRYGKGTISIQTPPGFLGVLEPRVSTVGLLDTLLKESFLSPVGQSRLKELVRKNKPGDVVIIVSDKTREIANYERILKFLVGELVDAGVDEEQIEFVVALGTHRAHTEEENRRHYGTLVDDFYFTQHDCHADLVSIGKTRTGLDVRVSRRVHDADFVIATGRVDFHYLAGYSGGRKSVLPGIASYETIRNNHKKLMRQGVWVGQLEGNVIAQEMAEAGSLLGIGYLLNVVETPVGETQQIFVGHHSHAFQEAVHYFSKARRVMIGEPADCVVVSAGGYPNDRDFYHTHKSMNLALSALKQNGSIVLVGQCEAGFGNEKFMRLMLENKIDSLLQFPEEKIDVGGHRAFLTARILKQHSVLALTGLDPEMIRRIHFMPVENIEQALDTLRKKHGAGMKTIFVPNGKAVLPLLNGKMKNSNSLGG